LAEAVAHLMCVREMCGSNPGRSNDNALLVVVSLPSGECRDGSLKQATAVLLRIHYSLIILHYLYSSLSIIKIIKSRRVRWARQVARKREGEARM
jgi:hypothetical protein